MAFRGNKARIVKEVSLVVWRVEHVASLVTRNRHFSRYRFL